MLGKEYLSSQHVRIQATRLGKHWPTCGLNDVFDDMGWLRRPNRLVTYLRKLLEKLCHPGIQLAYLRQWPQWRSTSG